MILHERAKSQTKKTHAKSSDKKSCRRDCEAHTSNEFPAASSVAMQQKSPRPNPVFSFACVNWFKNDLKAALVPPSVALGNLKGGGGLQASILVLPRMWKIQLVEQQILRWSAVVQGSRLKPVGYDVWRNENARPLYLLDTTSVPFLTCCIQTNEPCVRFVNFIHLMQHQPFLKTNLHESILTFFFSRSLCLWLGFACQLHRSNRKRKLCELPGLERKQVLLPLVPIFVSMVAKSAWLGYSCTKCTQQDFLMIFSFWKKKERHIVIYTNIFPKNKAISYVNIEINIYI